MKIVVTGGTGFIGSHLVDALVDQGHQVVSAQRRTDPESTTETDAVVRVPLDDVVRGVYDLAGTAAILHLAAIRHRWGASDADYLRTNVELTQRLLEQAQGRVGQFIYCSSIAVFGWPPRGPIDESYPYDPINIYGQTKVLCEKMVLEFHRRRKTECSIVRPSITYGRRDPTGMLTKLATMLDRGIYRTVGSGRNRVQLVHVADVVQGFLKTLQNPCAFGRSYIITARNPIRINDLVALVAGQIDRPVPAFRVPRALAGATASLLEGCYALGWKVTGHEPIIAREKIQVMTTDRHYSIARAEEEIGYTPEYDYERGVADFVSGLIEDRLLPGRQGQTVH